MLASAHILCLFELSARIRAASIRPLIRILQLLGCATCLCNINFGSRLKSLQEQGVIDVVERNNETAVNQ
jgi:hypothetical protein